MRVVMEVLTFAAALLASSSVERYELDAARSRIWFEADATLGHFRGNASKVSGWADLPESGLAQASGRVEIEAASLKTGIGLRDRHLRETLETGRNPRIDFALDSLRPATDTHYTMHGRLSIRGIERSVSAVVRVDLSDRPRIAGRIPVRFTDFGMAPPARMLGTARVRNDFTIGFDCVFARPPS